MPPSSPTRRSSYLVTLTLGNKFEHNSHTGLELMPNARLAWRVTDSTMLWSAVSRAVRTPSRFDRARQRSEEHTSELQSLMRISYAVFCLKKKTIDSIRAYTLPVDTHV